MEIYLKFGGCLLKRLLFQFEWSTDSTEQIWLTVDKFTVVERFVDEGRVKGM